MEGGGGGDSERFAHFSVKNVIEIGLMGEKSLSKMYLSKGFCFKFLLKFIISRQLWLNGLFSLMIDILSQNYPCKGLDKQRFQRKIVNIFYPSVLTYILGAQKPCLIEAFFFEYPQHMFWLSNKKIIF